MQCFRHPGAAHREIQPLSPGSCRPSKASMEPWLYLGFAVSHHGGIVASALAQLSQQSRPVLGPSQSKHRASRPWARQQLCCHRGFGLSLTSGAGDVPWPRESRLSPAQALAHGESSSGSQPSATRRAPWETPPAVNDKPLAFSGLKLSHWSFFPYVWDNVNIWTPVLLFPLSPYLHFKVKTTIKGFSKYYEFCMVPGGSKTLALLPSLVRVWRGKKISTWAAEQGCNLFRLCTLRGCMCPAKIYRKNMLFSVTD